MEEDNSKGSKALDSPTPERGIEPINPEHFSRKDPEQFLDFLRTVPVEFLLEHREHQAGIDKAMSFHFTRSTEWIDRVRDTNPDMVLLKTPYPVIELVSKGSIHFIHGAFQLSDSDYWYHFDEGWPIAELPDYLRPEDIIPSGRFSETYPKEVRDRVRANLGISEDEFSRLVYFSDPKVVKHRVMKEIPFNKPVNRVPVDGGEAERYNYRTAEWEPNGDGIYAPKLRQKIKRLAEKARKQVAELPKLPKRHSKNYKSLPKPKK